MPDTASHGAPELDTGEVRHTLSIHDVGSALLAAGVPRSHRQIIRYAETRMLDAVKVPGPTGDQWYVSPASIPKVIGDLKQWEAQRARQGAPRPAMSEPVVEQGALKMDTDTASHGAPEPAVSEAPVREGIEKANPTEPATAATELDTSRYVTQLEKRIEEKDDVIGLLKGQLVAKDEQLTQLSDRFTNLSDRFADTQKLMGVMQRMLAPLLGQADPYQRANENAGEQGSAPQA